MQFYKMTMIPFLIYIIYEDFQKSLKHYSLENNELEVIYSKALEEIKKEKSKLD